MKYEFTELGITKQTKDGVAQLSNFTAEIKRQTKYHDGRNTRTVLTIEGKMNDTKLETIDVDSEKFPSMSWVASNWGMIPIIFPEPNSERDIRTAIQMNSTPTSVNVYTHTGWHTINDTPTYLTATGGITAKGLNTAIRVELPTELEKIALPNPKEATKADFLNTMRIATTVTKSALGWTLIAAAFRAALGPADFAIHVSGQSGSFKSELASLIQSMFGPELEARYLPCSWSSTANALERQLYIAKNAIAVVDDFVPTGTAWQVKQLQKSADQIIRAQGNQAGRARMTDKTNLQATYYPRGIMLSTGEDIPTGHSIRARMIIAEMQAGEIDAADLTAAQAARPSYARTMAAWIHWIAKKGGPTKVKDEITEWKNATRDKYTSIGHSRTPTIIADLVTAIRLAMQFGVDEKFITSEESKDMSQIAEDKIVAQAQQIEQHLTETSPGQALIATIQSVIGSNLAHFRTRQGGIPRQAPRLGWIEITSEGEIPKYKAPGTKLGWIDWQKNELLLDPNTIQFLQRHSQGKLGITRQTLLKRLKDEGLLARTDSQRSRNTVRVTCEKATRDVVAFPVARILADDVPDDEDANDHEGSR